MARPRKSVPAKVQVPPGGWQARKPVVPNVETTKQPHVLDVDHEKISRRRLVWRFSDVDRDGAWPPAHIGAKAMGNLLEKMASFESMTLGEIFAAGSEHGKKYPIDSLPVEAQKRLVALERDDESEIARLRTGGRPRLYGFLREHVFHILWWDPEHQVYPSTKRRT